MCAWRKINAIENESEELELNLWYLEGLLKMQNYYS